MTNWLNKTHVGDCRDLLKAMAADGVRVQTCITSPPYYGLRDYGVENQIGLEPSLWDWLANIVEVFALVREILADDGTVWLNLGDSYASAGGAGWQGKSGQRADRRFTAVRDTVGLRKATRRPPEGLKPKDLMGQPWRAAFALQDDGWWLRSDVIWHKPNPMPESVTDRPTKSHEYLFLLAKSESYLYNADAIREPAETAGRAGERRSYKPGSSSSMNSGEHQAMTGAFVGLPLNPLGRNRRSVWTIPTTPFAGAHFATFPRALVEPCILSTSMSGDTVLDPFMGSGTVGQVSTNLGRQFVGCELNPAYVDLHDMRRTTIGMPI